MTTRLEDFIEIKEKIEALISRIESGSYLSPKEGDKKNDRKSNM